MPAKVTYLHPYCTEDHLGAIPMWLSHTPEGKPLTWQLNDCYGHGGGWDPFKGFTLRNDNALTYPGDPPQKPIAMIEVDGHEEKVFMYEHSWVAVIWPDRRFEVCRMD